MTPTSSSLERFVALFILLMFIGIGTLFAWRVPAWQAPDEPAHYNYIAQVATGDILPIIEMGDWDNAYLEQLKAEDFAPSLLAELDTVQYENHQPPLYYWLATPIFLLTNGSLFAVRMVSVLMGAITVGLTFVIIREVLPARTHLALASMVVVAFVPQNMHILTSVNNDALAGVMVAITLLLCVRRLKGQNDPLWWMGLAIGIIAITKTTAYFMVAIVGLTVFLRWLSTRKQIDMSSNLIMNYIQIAIPAAVFTVLYWGRNIATYGFPDFLGLQAHDEIVVGQQRRADLVADIGMDAYWERAFSTTYHSFWGMFGWMEARLADALPTVMLVITGVLLIGGIGLLVNSILALRGQSAQTDENQSANTTWHMSLILITMILLALAQFVYYNLTFVQFQGRYLFVAIIPFAAAVALGLDTWRAMLFAKPSWLKWGVVGVCMLLAPLNVYLIWRVIPCAVGCL
ncbi:MAG: glycosyltransferase family 39 protein [Chloroflexota bacterium]